MFSVEKVIDKLIEGTKSNKYKWSYLADYDAVIPICREFTDTFVTGDNLNMNTSFLLKINGGFLTICEDMNSNLLLIIIPSIDSRDIQCVNKDGDLCFQQELLRLQNLIKKQFPNVDDFLEEFMGD